MILGVSEVARDGIGEPVQRDMEAGAEAAGVHRGMDEGQGGAPSCVVPLHQDRCPGQVLGDLPIICALDGLHKPGVGIIGGVEAGQVGRGEGVRHIDLVPAEQFAGAGVPIGSGEGVPVFGPQGAQDQHRGP
ncbi:hypothetical protein DBP19_36790 [Streptomyces sp. CS090A]|nr:hypothetical protein DBP19_36790 [Streptomyces sp. CS090A]